MGWEVGLTGDLADLDTLARSFRGPDLIIDRKGDGYVLASPEFDAIGDAGTIRGRGLEYLELLNGAARLALGSRTPIGIGNISQLHADGRRDAYVFPEPAVVEARAYAASITVQHLDGSEETYHPADPVIDWVRLAYANSAVARALRLLGTGVWDWVNLYRIFEVVSDDFGGTDKIEAEGWATIKAMKLFKHTANSPGALGIASRHGSETTVPPARPMLLHEAKSLVLGIVQSWLVAKTTTTA